MPRVIHYTYIFVAATPCYAFCKRQARPFVETRGKNAGFLEGNILMSGLMPFLTFCGPCTVLLWALFIVGMAVASARAFFLVQLSPLRQRTKTVHVFTCSA